MKRTVPALFACALIAGCGGGGDHGASTTKTSTTTSSAIISVTAQLEQSVRGALQQNARVSVYVLEHNAIPSWAKQSTAGPALAGLRGSAAQRSSGHITVHVLSDEVQVHSINLAASYATATANVTERSRVVPLHKGRPLGKAVVGNERARFTLHRASGGTFVVWSVKPA